MAGNCGRPQAQGRFPQETWERGLTPFIGTRWYQYTYRSSPVFLRSRLEAESDEEVGTATFVRGPECYFVMRQMRKRRAGFRKRLSSGGDSVIEVEQVLEVLDTGKASRTG